MFKVKTTITINKDFMRSLRSKSRTALFMTGEDLLEDVKQAQVFPYDTGRTQNTTIVKTTRYRNVIQLLSNVPYASRIYFHPEFNFQTTHNKHARGLWYEMWINGNKQNFCVDHYAANLRKIL